MRLIWMDVWNWYSSNVPNSILKAKRQTQQNRSRTSMEISNKWANVDEVMEAWKAEYCEIQPMLSKKSKTDGIIKFLISNTQKLEEITQIERFCILSMWISIVPTRKQNGLLLLVDEDMAENSAEIIVKKYNNELKDRNIELYKNHKVSGVFVRVFLQFFLLLIKFSETNI